jgi:2-phospho-L-lactate/phosphoenolpyruvate guanylyltransferase
MSAESGVWAVVVARVVNGAKSRLSPALDATQRRDLALAMLADVLDVCANAGPVLAGLVAVVDDPSAGAQAEQFGAVVVDDPTPGDMNAAVTLGLHAVRGLGAHTAIVLPGDVPRITVADLATLVGAAADASRAVVVGASRDGLGTNALLLRPVDVIAPAFGPPSVDRHLRAGQQAGALTRVQRDLSLALDVDTPADLAALAELPMSPHTARLLAHPALI